MKVQSLDRKQASLFVPYIIFHYDDIPLVGLLAPFAALAVDLGRVLDRALHHH
jgi:hypothetical protein